MTIQPLPPAVTRLLNVLRAELEEIDHELQEFQAERRQFLEWIDLHATFTLDSSEEAGFENLRLLWTKIDAALTSGETWELTRLLVEAYAARADLRAERAARGLAADERVNSAILAGQAFLEGRADPAALTTWLAQLEAYLDAAWERVVRVGLPASESGPTAFAQGIREWKEQLQAPRPDRETWEAVFSWLRVGAQGIETALSPSASSQAETEGPDLLRLGRTDLETEAIPEELDDLARRWQEHLDTLLLPLAQRDQLQEKMDELLEQLVELDSATWSEASPWLDQVEKVWRSASIEHARRPALPSNEEALLQAISGVLRQTVPDLIMADFVQFCQEEAGRPLPGLVEVKRYLVEGELDHLHLAVDNLLASADSRY